MASLLWLHGLGESSRCFAAVADHPALATVASTIPDLAGYGRSRWPDAPLPLAALADQLAEVLRAHGERPVLVGHSMGGVIGVLLAERHPEALAGLVNVDGNVSPGDCTFSGRAAGFDLPAFVERGFAELQAYVAAGGAADRALAGYHDSMVLADPRSFHLHACELVELSAPETMGRRMAALAVPVTYVAGAPGGACARSLELLDAAGVRRVDIGPAGHWPFIDQPDAFATALVGLLGDPCMTEGG